jgi:hypothetical protein
MKFLMIGSLADVIKLWEIVQLDYIYILVNVIIIWLKMNLGL